MSDRRRALLAAGLGFMRLRWCELGPSVMGTFARWMNSWAGIGAVVVGMTAQGYDIVLQQYPNGWRAHFSLTGIAHSVVHGSAYEPTPWRAVHAAAWDALAKAETDAR